MDPGAIQPAPHAPPPVSGSLADVADGLPGAREIIETLTLRAGFNTNTVILGTTLLGVAAGVIGVFALLRKRSLVTDALSHATLPGIGLAFLGAGALGIDGRSLPVLLAGAAATGVLGVACIQALLRYTRLREDAAIGIVLSVFFGAGVVVLSYIQANAASGAAGLNKFIYGQTAAMGMGDAALMASIAGAAVVLALLLLKELTLVCFDDAFARVGGWPVGAIDLLMMGLVVLVTVAGLQAVGLILVVAMLIIPPVAARFWTERLWLLVALSGIIGGASGYLGSVVSALLPRKPAGAVIVLTAGAVFACSMLLAPARGVLAAGLRPREDAGPDRRGPHARGRATTSPSAARRCRATACRTWPASAPGRAGIGGSSSRRWSVAACSSACPAAGCGRPRRGSPGAPASAATTVCGSSISSATPISPRAMSTGRRIRSSMSSPTS